MLEDGRLLSDLNWEQFEALIAELLERDGWSVSGMKRTKDGGIDVWGTIILHDLGEVQSIWQAKKYGPGRKVELHQVRELSGVLDRSRASKALIVTTSSLTRGAIDWIREDRFRLGYHDGLSA
jgi:restriction system protein